MGNPPCRVATCGHPYEDHDQSAMDWWTPGADTEDGCSKCGCWHYAKDSE